MRIFGLARLLYGLYILTRFQVHASWEELIFQELRHEGLKERSDWCTLCTLMCKVYSSPTPGAGATLQAVFETMEQEIKEMSYRLGEKLNVVVEASYPIEGIPEDRCDHECTLITRAIFAEDGQKFLADPSNFKLSEEQAIALRPHDKTYVKTFKKAYKRYMDHTQTSDEFKCQKDCDVLWEQWMRSKENDRSNFN